MKIKEHFSKMLITIGWTLTACILVYGVLFTVCELWEVMWGWKGLHEIKN